MACTLILALAACAAPPPTPDVTLERRPSGDWRAIWHSDEPIQTLKFVRPANYLREREWRIITPGYAFSRDGDAQVVQLADGASASAELMIEFPVNTEFMPRDYELFNVFSNGSAAIYTGHFFALINAGTKPLTNVAVAAPAGQRVVLDPQPGPLGTYAYVGDLELIDHARFVAIIDPGLPRWLETTLVEQIPAMFGFYESRTGRVLEQRPVVLFSFVPGHGADMNAGVLENLMHLRASGDRWHNDDPWAMRKALRLIAHEAAHFWNGNSRPGSPPWMHEGSAEAFADEALTAADFMDARSLADAYELALNGCVVGGQRHHYTCGQIAAWWTGLAISDADPGADLFTFWGALATRAAAGDGYYGPDEYFAVLEAFGVPADAVAELRAFTEHSDDAGAAVRAGVSRYGVVVERDDVAAEPSARFAASTEFLMALLAADCRGGYGFYTRDNAVELGGLGDCGHARDGMVIDAFGGEPLDAPNFAAARFALAQCANGGRVDVGPAEFVCPEELPPLRGYWTITGESP